MPSGLTNFQIWREPLLLGVLCTVGLTAALLADGIWDAFSWITLAVPLVVAVWFTLSAGKNA